MWHIGPGYAYAPIPGTFEEPGGASYGFGDGKDGGNKYRAPMELGGEKRLRNMDREETTAGNGMGRITWTDELHKEFLRAVDIIGVEQAVPMAILKMMRVDGLTREQVASHLQKHRTTLKREREGKERELLVRAVAKNVFGGDASEEAVLVAVREREEGNPGARGRGKSGRRVGDKRRGGCSPPTSGTADASGTGTEFGAQDLKGKRLRKYVQ